MNRFTLLFIFGIAGLCAAPVAQAQPATASTNGADGAQAPRVGGFRRMMEDSTNIVKL